MRFAPVCLCLAACGVSDVEVELDAEAIDSEAFALEAEPEELIAFARGLKQGRFGADPAAINVGGVLHVYSTSRDGLNIPHLAGANPLDVGSLTVRSGSRRFTMAPFTAPRLRG